MRQFYLKLSLVNGMNTEYRVCPYRVPVGNFILYDVALVLVLWSRFRRVIDNKSCPPKKARRKKQQCVYLMNRNSGKKTRQFCSFSPDI